MAVEVAALQVSPHLECCLRFRSCKGFSRSALRSSKGNMYKLDISASDAKMNYSRLGEQRLGCLEIPVNRSYLSWSISGVYFHEWNLSYDAI